MEENQSENQPASQPDATQVEVPVTRARDHRPFWKKLSRRTWMIIGGGVLLVAAVVIYLLWRPDHSDEIVMPFIAHQKPAVDPHLPSTNSLADKLDEVEFDGLFNLTASPSGVVYEDGLGEFLNIDENDVVSIRLKTAKRWHDSWRVTADGDKFTITKGPDHLFSAKDVNFTLKRIQSLGSLSPDYILVSQAVGSMGFEGPDENNVIRFAFRADRIWKEADIKEVLSFKILPDKSDMNALNYTVGTAAYMALPPKEGVSNYYRSPDGVARIRNILLSPHIDNSTYTTELRNNNINVQLETPFGSLSSLLENSEKYFYKSNISNTFFALFFNTQRLSREQRKEVRKLINARQIVDRFFKVNTPQARHIADYKGNKDNYYDYVNRGVFPSSSYYMDEEIITPVEDTSPPNTSILPDTVRVQACLNYGFREEYSELIDILNDPAVTRGKMKVTAVGNDEIKRGNYDALLIAITGYRSNFLFDLYNLFLREPDLETYRINLVTDESGATPTVDPASMQSTHNFFRLDARADGPDREEVDTFLQYIYGFMSTHNIGDKQEYARRVDELERSMSLGAWMFSLPSLAYFSTQFDSTTIDLYGVASQLSTIKKWEEKKK
jgi:hypothetical protein